MSTSAPSSTLPLQPGSAQLHLNDVVDIIIQDHRHIKSCYEKFLTEINLEERKKYAYELIRSVAVHSHCEELVVYPVFETRLPNGKDVANHSREEHLQVKKDLYNLDQMDPNAVSFSALLRKIMEELNRHIEEEETTLLPLFRSCVDRELLRDLSVQWYNQQKIVPTRPHPDAPDRPPLQTVVGLMAAPIDKARDLTREFPEEVKGGVK